MKKGSIIAGSIFTFLFAIAGGVFCFIGASNHAKIMAIIGLVLAGLSLIISSSTTDNGGWIAALIAIPVCFALKIISMNTVFAIPWLFVHGEKINLYFITKTAFVVCVLLFFQSAIVFINTVSDRES